MAIWKKYLVCFITMVSLAATAYAAGDNGMISGKLLSLDEEPIEYATVVLKGTSLSCSTNEKGIYHISAPAGGNCFLMVMYDRSLTEKNPAATELAIFDASSKKLTYVTGLPENVSSIGKTVYNQNGNVYIPVNVENEEPAIYAISTSTAKAVKGVSVKAKDITGFGYLTPVK